jgi:hypothetical protein
MHRPFLLSLFAAGALLRATPALAADPTTADCLAASDASLRLGNEHKLRAERSQLLVCASSSCPLDIRKECVRRVEEVNAEIPTIAFSAKDPSGADLTTVRVTSDGEVLAERLEGTALSIDPGEHAFTFETAGQARVTKKLIIVEGQKDRRELVTFGSPRADAAFPVQPSAAVAPGAASGGLGGQRIAALAVGGLGVVGLGLGTAFGILASSQRDDARAVCPNQCATVDGVHKWDTATSSANVATVAFIAGGVVVAGAAVLWFTAPRASSATAQVGLGPGSVQLEGTW